MFLSHNGRARRSLYDFTVFYKIAVTYFAFSLSRNEDLHSLLSTFIARLHKYELHLIPISSEMERLLFALSVFTADGHQALYRPVADEL
jgi:hypothetical protein